MQRSSLAARRFSCKRNRSMTRGSGCGGPCAPGRGRGGTDSSTPLRFAQNDTGKGSWRIVRAAQSRPLIHRKRSPFSPSLTRQGEGFTGDEGRGTGAQVRAPTGAEREGAVQRADSPLRGVYPPLRVFADLAARTYSIVPKGGPLTRAARCAALQYEKGWFRRTSPGDYFTVSLAEALVTLP